MRKWLNIVGIVVMLAAIGWQASLLYLQSKYGGPENTVNVAKLLGDLRSEESQRVHLATTNLWSLAGVDEIRPQLVKAGKPILGLS